MATCRRYVVVCHKLNDALLRNVLNTQHSRENVLLISGNLQLGMGATVWMYEGELHENLKLHVASGAAIFTILLRRRVAFQHRTATCRPLFKPSVSLLSTYRQSSCVSYFYRTFKVFIWLSLIPTNWVQNSACQQMSSFTSRWKFNLTLWAIKLPGTKSTQTCQ